MKTTISGAVLIILALQNAEPAHADIESHKLMEPHVSNRVLIKRKSGAKNYTSGIGEFLDAKVSAASGPSQLDIVDFDSSHSMQEALFLYGIDPGVEFVEPDYLIFASESAPNDSHFSLQWGLNNETDDVDINALQLWDHSADMAEVYVAVIDSGVNYKHPDLAANMWINPAEIANNGIDDDKNGYVDDVHGINAIRNIGNPLDDNGHGSHVSGIIAGVRNNDEGISGVVPNAKIITCKFLGMNGSGSTSDAIKCLDYILDLKTRSEHPINIAVSNNSWASNTYSQALYNAIKLQADNGIVFVAAADNYGVNNDIFDTYPANYQLANVISVAAVDRHGKLAAFSNYGPHSVHVAAPGVQIYSTLQESSYGNLDGTSMAAPFVTGLFAALSNLIPANSWTQNKNLIIASEKTLLDVEGKTMGHGIIRSSDEQGRGALTCADQVVFQTLMPKKDIISYDINSPITVQALNINCANPNGDFSAKLNPTGEVIDFHDDGELGDELAADGIYSAHVPLNNRGAAELVIDGQPPIKLERYDSSSWHGYRLTKNEIFNYIDIVGTKLNLRDDDITAIQIPFAIPFGGDEVGLSHLYIGSNGTISLTDHQILDYVRTDLPVANMNAILAPLWTDLDPSAPNTDNGIFYDVIGEAPNRQIVIEWRGVRYYNSSSKATFQVVLSENNSEVIYSYKTLESNQSNRTVGVQTRDMAVNLAGSGQQINDHLTLIWATNTPPIADAGGDQTATINDGVQLDASGSHDLEAPASLSYHWRQISGPSITLEDDNSPVATVSSSLAGTAIFELKVSDDGDAFSVDTVEVVFNDPPAHNDVDAPTDGDSDEPEKNATGDGRSGSGNANNRTGLSANVGSSGDFSTSISPSTTPPPKPTPELMVSTEASSLLSTNVMDEPTPPDAGPAFGGLSGCNTTAPSNLSGLWILALLGVATRQRRIHPRPH